jgi:hypothetical protein
MKKIIATIAIAGSALALAACGSTTEKANDEVEVDIDLLAEVAWGQISPSDRQDICNGYYLSPELTEQIAYSVMDEPEWVPSFMRVVRKEC